MTDAREHRLRRWAEVKGLALKRYRSRTPDDPLYGTYMLVDTFRDVIVAGDQREGYGLTLDEIEAALTRK